ncbi:MAG: M81 family metallopeptidase [Ruminococcaceae bacterium]|nr:M81 family metallopeptidase [Oscillospiraceae bacterium]
MKKRVFVCSFQQESNVFNPIVSTAASFGRGKCETHIGAKSMIGGIIAPLLDADFSLSYGLAWGSYSGGPVADTVWQDFLRDTLDHLTNEGPFDGVAICMHGATVSETNSDVCGEIAAAVRTAVGEHVPIAVAYDLHANITRKTAKNVNYICGFHEYPHTDQYETGARAAKLLRSHLEGNSLKTAYATIPMIAPAHAYTTREGGLLRLLNEAKEMVEQGEIADFSIFEAQPWLDVPEFSSALVVTARDADTAKRVANNLVLRHYALRQELQGLPLMSIQEVIERALSNKTGKPVVLVDSADSRGAGSTADSAAVIEALLPYRDELRAAVGISDAPAVENAFRLGVGGVADFTLGATVAPSLSHPVLVKDARVRSLHQGDFFNVGPVARGAKISCGRVAVLEVGKLLLQVSEHSRNERDIGFFRGFGIDPELCQLVSVKACTSLRVAYTPISAEICNTATPGAAGTVLQELPYQKRPSPLYPFEEISENDIVCAVCYR